MTIRALTISTLGPIHVGCDEVYEPSQFVIHGGLLHALDPADLAADLSDNERKQLAALADRRDPIGPLQCFFRDRAERFAALSRHQVAVAEAIAAEYEQKAGKAVQKGDDGRPVYKLFPIARTAFRPIDAAPYLPGSSLKGSIRTAWLNRQNRGLELPPEDMRDRKNRSRRLQERLLRYQTGRFEDDPFRHVALADAQPEEDGLPPPTRVLYAVSKRKQPKENEPRGIDVFLEALPEALPGVLHSEIRLAGSGNIRWNTLCDACNAFYRPQLEADLNHDILGNLLDHDWKCLIGSLIGGELGELMEARQGFLLRVGRHSGAESVTLEGVRDIKILGKRGDPPTFRSATTQKRFASLTKAGERGLLPFGWIWVDAADDAHRHLTDAVLAKLAARSAPLREAHADRLVEREAIAARRQQAAVERARQHQMEEAEALATAQAEAARLAALEKMSANARRIEAFRTAFADRKRQLGASKEKQNADYHGRARKLAQDALEGPDWTAEEKRAAADAIAEWLPQVVEKIDKDALKKLKLSALRGQTP